MQNFSVLRLICKTTTDIILPFTISDPVGHHSHTPIIDLSRFNPADYPIDDEDERMRQQRAREMAEGVDVELSSLVGEVSIRNERYPAHSQV